MTTQKLFCCIPRLLLAECAVVELRIIVIKEGKKKISNMNINLNVYLSLIPFTIKSGECAVVELDQVLFQA